MKLLIKVWNSLKEQVKGHIQEADCYRLTIGSWEEFYDTQIEPLEPLLGKHKSGHGKGARKRK